MLLIDTQVIPDLALCQIYQLVLVELDFRCI